LGFFTFFIFTPLYSAWCIKQPLTAFYGAITRIVFSEVVVVVIIKALFRNTVATTWLKFIVDVIFVGAFSMLIYAICVFDKAERARITGLVKKVVHK
jgi:hypothetical protein